MAKQVKVASFNEIPEGDLKRVKVGEQEIAIYKIGGKIYATSNICTHEQCTLDQYHAIHFDVVECTCHGSQFDIKTGNVVIPPAVENLKTFRTQLIGNDIFVYL